MSNLKVFSGAIMAPCGQMYSVRYLLTPEELKGLQAIGFIGPVDELIGMQDAADQIAAQYEAQAHAAMGGALQ